MPHEFGSQPPPSPEHGAAYRVLYERTQPAYCTTQHRRGEIAAEFAVVTAWAETQTVQVKAAYAWATAYILRDVDSRLQMYARAKRVESAFASIPRPEGW